MPGKDVVARHRLLLRSLLLCLFTGLSFALYGAADAGADALVAALLVLTGVVMLLTMAVG